MPDNFTPEQIAQILEEFFRVVGTRQYIGARYVPLFGRKDEDTIEWDNDAPYEPLTIVLYQGNSYTSRQYVPVGVEITNQEFWAITGNYNAQVEMYRQETAAVREIAEAAQDDADAAQADIDTLLPKADFDAENTVKDYIDASVATVQADIDTLLPKADFDAENTVKKYVDDSIEAAVPSKEYFDYHFISSDLRYCDYDAIERIGTIVDFSGHTFQGGCYLNNHYYVAHYLPNNATQISKYDSSLNLIETLTLPVAHHINSINVDPVSGNLLCGGTASTSRLEYFVVNPTDMTIVQTVNFGYVNSFCISPNGLYALAALQGSNAYLVYKKTGSNYVMQGFTKPLDLGFIGRQGITQFNTGYMRLSSRAGLTVANYLHCFTAQGCYKFSVVFSNKYDVEYEWATYIDRNKILLGDVEGNIYKLDPSAAFEGFSEFNEVGMIDVTPDWVVNTSSSAAVWGNSVIKSALGNYYFATRQNVPSMFAAFGAGYKGFIAGGGQRCIVSSNSAQDQMAMVGFVAVSYGLFYWQFDYKLVDNTSHGGFYLSGLKCVDFKTGKNYSTSFTISDSGNDYRTKIDTMLGAIQTDTGTYGFSSSTIPMGIYSLGVNGTLVQNQITEAPTRLNTNIYEFVYQPYTIPEDE